MTTRATTNPLRNARNRAITASASAVTGVRSRRRVDPRPASPARAGTDWRRFARPLAVGLTILLAVCALVLFAWIRGGLESKGWLGADFVAYRMFGQHFLETGDPYMPAQYLGPWAGPGNQANLYPPPAILLFAAFAFIPAPLWWGIPLGIVIWVVWSWRPAYWSWPIIAAICCTVPFLASLSTGNSDLWVMAVIALATRWPAAAWFLVAKPSMLPLTVFWILRRRYWQGFLVAAAVSAAMLPLWFNWITVLHNYVGAPGIGYGLTSWPFVLIPVLARVAARPGVDRGRPRASLPRLALRRAPGAHPERS